MNFPLASIAQLSCKRRTEQQIKFNKFEIFGTKLLSTSIDNGWDMSSCSMGVDAIRQNSGSSTDCKWAALLWVSYRRYISDWSINKTRKLTGTFDKNRSDLCLCQCLTNDYINTKIPNGSGNWRSQNWNRLPFYSDRLQRSVTKTTTSTKYGK